MTYSRLKAQEQMTELAEEVGTDGEDDDEKCDESSVGERSEVRTTLDDGDGDDDEATGGGSRRSPFMGIFFTILGCFRSK